MAFILTIFPCLVKYTPSEKRRNRVSLIDGNFFLRYYKKNHLFVKRLTAQQGGYITMTENTKNTENIENTDTEPQAPSDRKKGPGIFAVIAIVLFALVVAAPWVLMFTVGDNAASESEGGLNEKRELTAFPTTFSNNYFSRFESFFNDHSPLRNRLISFETDFSQRYETFYRRNISPKLTEWLLRPSSPSLSDPSDATLIPPPTSAPDPDEHSYALIKTQNADEEHYGYKLSVCTDCGKYQFEITENKRTDTSYLVPQSSNNVIYGRYDWLFFEGDNSVGYYQGTNILSNAEMNSMNKTLEALQDVCNKKGIRLVVMTAPNKEQAYPEYMPSYPVSTQQKRQDLMLQYMQINSTVKYLYPLTELNNAKYMYDIFYKQDTHWNAIGGFVGTMAVYEALGMETTDLYALDVTETTRDGGDLSNFCGYHTVYTNYEVNYKPEINVTVEYLEGSTVGGTELRQYTSDSPNQAKLVVLGDSFRNSMSDFLAKDFSKATIAHRNDFSHSAVRSALKELSAGDVLLLVAVERYDMQNISMAQTLTSFLR